jgi:Dipeptidyl aminopeptidases/acylaminoacyl-peptidases
MSCQTVICNIPCLQVMPSVKPKGTILLYHGWVSNIHDYCFFASLIASWGYQVIVPELPLHGERGTLDYFDKAVLQQYFWKVVIQSVQEAELLVSEMSETDDPIGIVGHSTGGFIAAGLYSKNPRLQAAIVINGSCAWVNAEALFRKNDGRSPMTSIERRFLEEHDPMSHLNHENSRGLLLLHGTVDATIPIDSQRYFMKRMSQYQVPSDSMQFVEYSNVNHQITLAMLEKSKQWLENHLCRV